MSTSLLALMPLPPPEGCGRAHFAQWREIGERSEGGTSGLRWYIANSFRPFLPADHPYPAQILPPDARRWLNDVGST
jgi:hypothetical protein